MTETAHPKIDFAADTFKQLVWDNALDLGLKFLFTEAPYLNIPILRDIIRGVSKWAADGLFGALKKFTDMAAIPIINAELKAKFTEASGELRVMYLKYGMEDQRFIAARKVHQDAFADFMRNNATR